MPRFFLHLRNEVLAVSDNEGFDADDTDSARIHAVESVRGFLSHEVAGGTLDLRGQIDIADENGKVLTTIPFSEAVTIITVPQLLT